jgi:chromosome partitioning protein
LRARRICPSPTLAQRTSSVLERLRDSARSARADERREPTFPIGKAAELVGRTAAAIREAEKDGLPPPPRTENNRRVGYTLAQLNDMRGLFGTRPWRAATDPCCVIAVQNFKGGVGKSTLSVHLAQYLAIKGYRAALIDCDSQASATTLFGYVPDLDLTEEDTLYPFLRHDDMESLDYALRKTHFDGLELVPANLRLFQSEYEIAARMARGQGTSSTAWRKALQALPIVSMSSFSIRRLRSVRSRFRCCVRPMHWSCQCRRR